MTANIGWLTLSEEEARLPSTECGRHLPGWTVRWTTPLSIPRGQADCPACRQIAGGERRGRARDDTQGRTPSHNVATPRPSQKEK
ncbi:hypothetical protein RB595_009284 [Gaeumannomyces hyphopodioides]